MEYVVFFLLLCVVVAVGSGLPNTLVGLRDLVARLRLVGKRPVAIASARRGRVMLRGRIARRRLLKSPDGTRLCVAWSSRQGWHANGTAASEPFELIDATGTARIDADRPVLLAPDEDGYEGEHTRVIADGEEVVVYGECVREIASDGVASSFREPPQALVLRGRHVVIAPVGKSSGRNLVRGIYGLSWGALCIAIGVAMWL